MQDLQPADAQVGPPHLPIQPTPFVGRRDEIDTLVAQMATPGCRLITLVGTGGIGKTRLALEVAPRLSDNYPDGVHLVELAGVSDPALAARAVASILELMDEAERSGLETLVAALRRKRLLLILDNCEHLLSACAELARELLAACPGLCVLATSREPLHTAGEVIWEVPPLSLPALEQLVAPSELLAVDAVTLFVDRAQRVLPAFELTRQNALTVAQVCHRLDGVPLAIELAAARIRVLSVAQIHGRLDDCLRLLAGGDRLAPARHQTLRATLDWSYELLTAADQRLLQRLSVFAGTFRLAAAEAICSSDGLEPASILELLSSLVDKSLVVAERPGGKVRRVRLLETIRGYASDKLATVGDGEQWRDRHLAWYLRFAEGANPSGSWGYDDVLALERIELERDNLRGAMRWAIDKSRADQAHRLGVALAWYWHRRAHISEGSMWLEQILPLAGEVAPPIRVLALTAAGSFALWQGDRQQGITLSQEAVSFSRDSGCPVVAAWALQRLATQALHDGDDEKAFDRLAESLELFSGAGDELGVAISLIFWGEAAAQWGDHKRAEALFRVSLRIAQGPGDVLGSVYALDGLALVARHRGQLREATAYLQEVLRLTYEMDSRLELILCLEHLGSIACDQNLPERAACLFGASESQHKTTGSTWRKRDPDRDIQAVRATLGDAAFEAAIATGREMTLAQAVAFALDDSADLETSAAARDPSLVGQGNTALTARQREVAALIGKGRSNRAIADELNRDGVPTAQGGRQWWPGTVRSVLRSAELDREAEVARASL
mgnify:FL=1